MKQLPEKGWRENLARQHCCVDDAASLSFEFPNQAFVMLPYLEKGMTSG
jgi:hypothetical protein